LAVNLINEASARSGHNPYVSPSAKGDGPITAHAATRAISLVLDHISATKGTVTGAIYVKYSFDREKREPLELWATHLSNLLV
jgi:hypothetical protein